VWCLAATVFHHSARCWSHFAVTIVMFEQLDRSVRQGVPLVVTALAHRSAYVIDKLNRR
jgi:hypothetical protein